MCLYGPVEAQWCISRQLGKTARNQRCISSRPEKQSTDLKLWYFPLAAEMGMSSPTGLASGRLLPTAITKNKLPGAELPFLGVLQTDQAPYHARRKGGDAPVRAYGTVNE